MHACLQPLGNWVWPCKQLTGTWTIQNGDLMFGVWGMAWSCTPLSRMRMSAGCVCMCLWYLRTFSVGVWCVLVILLVFSAWVIAGCTHIYIYNVCIKYQLVNIWLEEVSVERMKLAPNTFIFPWILKSGITATGLRQPSSVWRILRTFMINAT